MLPIDEAVERLALYYGRVAVKEGFADGVAHATVPTGDAFHISEEGVITHAGIDFSVDWSYEA